MTEKFTITKLTGSENYATWSTDLRIVLKHHRHWSWIEGANEQPPLKTIKSLGTPQPLTSAAAADAEVENPAYNVWRSEEHTSELQSPC